MIKSAVSLGKNSFQKKPGLTRELIDAVLVRSLKFLACTTKIDAPVENRQDIPWGSRGEQMDNGQLLIVASKRCTNDYITASLWINQSNPPKSIIDWFRMHKILLSYGLVDFCDGWKSTHSSWEMVDSEWEWVHDWTEREGSRERE